MNPSLVGIPMATTAVRIELPIPASEGNESAVRTTEEADELRPAPNIPSDKHPQSRESLKIRRPVVCLPPLFIDSVVELKGLSDAIAAFKDCYTDANYHLESIKAAVLEKLPQETPKFAQKGTLPSPTGGGCDSGQANTSSSPTEEINGLRNPESQESSKRFPPTVSFPPFFMNSIAGLKGLSDAVAAFKDCYSDIHNLLESIKAAIMVKPPQVPPKVAPKDTLLSPAGEACEARTIEKQEEKHSQTLSELEGLCKAMSSRNVRKHLTTHLSDLPRLREEVPKALRQAPSPSQLVLDCMGKFFLQGTKAFAKNSPMIASREASVFMLECFLLMMGMDNSHENGNGALDSQKPAMEAEAAALAWRKRLITEGGLEKSSQIDARGLLMFVACFGIPRPFKRDDIRDLAIAANAKEIIGLLRNSHTLMKKIPEIVEEMMKHKMEVYAVDLTYIFGLEERYNPGPILVSFLQRSKDSVKKQKKGAQGSAGAINESKKQQLSSLKSVTKCLGRHNVEAEKLLPGWQINQMIAALEKEISDATNKPGDGQRPPKRKSDEAESYKKRKKLEAKRSRFAGHGPQHHNPARHLDYRRNSLDSGHTRPANSYAPFPSVVYGGPGAGLVPDRGITTGGSVSMTTSYAHIHPTGSYPVVHGGGSINSSGKDANSGTHHYGYGDSVMNERYAAQPSLYGLTSLYRTSVDGFAGAPGASSVGADGRTNVNDRYHFADTAVERYSVGAPRSNAAIPGAAVSAYRPSYFHQPPYLHQAPYLHQS